MQVFYQVHLLFSKYTFNIWHTASYSWVFNSLQSACRLVTSKPTQAKISIYYYTYYYVYLPKLYGYYISIFFPFISLFIHCTDNIFKISLFWFGFNLFVCLFSDNLFPTSCVIQSTCKQSKPSLVLRCDFYPNRDKKLLL